MVSGVVAEFHPVQPFQPHFLMLGGKELEEILEALAYDLCQAVILLLGG